VIDISPQVKLLIGAGLIAVLVAAAVITLMREPEAPPAPGTGVSSKVDHYLLALSWSPSYCLEADEEADARQCNASKSYGFIVRGLWPQTDTGPLRNCAEDKSRVSQTIVDDMAEIMPSARLVGNQWRKHGVCTGLSQGDYFDLTRRAYGRIKVPEEFHTREEARFVNPRDIERAFLTANPGLTADMVGVTCTERFVHDVRICLSTDLAFRTCKAARNECREDQVTMPPTTATQALDSGTPAASE
jgi:ribonuclease T2